MRDTVLYYKLIGIQKHISLTQHSGRIHIEIANQVIIQILRSGRFNISCCVLFFLSLHTMNENFCHEFFIPNFKICTCSCLRMT